MISLWAPPPQNGWNIACHASAQDNCDVMKWLLEHMSNYGADANQANKVGGAILMYYVIIITCRKDSLLC